MTRPPDRSGGLDRPLHEVTKSGETRKRITIEMQTVMIDGGIPQITFETDRWAQPTEPEHHVLQIGGRIMLAMEDDTEVPAGKLELLLVGLSTAREYGFRHSMFWTLN